MSDAHPSDKLGPLDELVPGLRAPDARYPLQDVHPRALELALEDGGHALVLCVWRTPESLPALHAQLKPLIEAAMLAELSRPPGELREQAKDLRALMLMSFAPLAFDAEEALAPFGLRRGSLRSADARAAAALWRREALRVDGEVADEPCAVFVAPFAGTDDPRVLSAQAEALAEAPDAPWGSHPGVLARSLADALARVGVDGIEPTHAGIDRLERALVPDTTDAVRWLHPVAFQGLCDLLAVAAHEWGLEVQWGVCEPDGETRLAPPPLIHVARPGSSGHVPLGEHVLRSCIMPRRSGETIPPLADWAHHEFT